MRGSEAWFHQLLDAAPVMIWASGVDAACTYFNASWLAYTGRKLEEELGDGWAKGVHPDDLTRCVAIYRDHFDRRARFRMEYRLRRADGSYGWILDDGVPRYAEDGAFLGFIGSCVDITASKQAEQARRSQSVTRSFARRLLHDITRRSHVTDAALRETGRALAKEHPGGDLVSFIEAFRDMGAGELRLVARLGGRLEFAADDMLERRDRSSLPTCYLALGYLEGAVSAAEGRPALGNEMRCRSMGHEECRFTLIVQ